MSSTRLRRLLWLRAGTRLAQLEDSCRPLLFSRMPRMLRGDGGTAESLQSEFGYVDQGRDSAAPSVVSAVRWRRALATSRKLAVRRALHGRDP